MIYFPPKRSILVPLLVVLETEPRLLSLLLLLLSILATVPF